MSRIASARATLDDIIDEGVVGIASDIDDNLEDPPGSLSPLLCESPFAAKNNEFAPAPVSTPIDISRLQFDALFSAASASVIASDCELKELHTDGGHGASSSSPDAVLSCQPCSSEQRPSSLTKRPRSDSDMARELQDMIDRNVNDDIIDAFLRNGERYDSYSNGSSSSAAAAAAAVYGPQTPPRAASSCSTGAWDNKRRATTCLSSSADIPDPFAITSASGPSQHQLTTYGPFTSDSVGPFTSDVVMTPPRLEPTQHMRQQLPREDVPSTSYDSFILWHYNGMSTPDRPPALTKFELLWSVNALCRNCVIFIHLL